MAVGAWKDDVGIHNFLCFPVNITEPKDRVPEFHVMSMIPEKPHSVIVSCASAQ